MAFNAFKFKSDIEKAFRDKAKEATQLTDSDKGIIGLAAVTEMLSAISKGISPIAGRGRFPGYKNPERYPGQVKHKFPSKRERPVNLELSGEFLKSLIAKPTPTGVDVGFFNDLSTKKEQGHRDGANGQPSRPIIPTGQETLNPSIYSRIVQTLTQILNQKNRT